MTKIKNLDQLLASDNINESIIETEFIPSAVEGLRVNLFGDSSLPAGRQVGHRDRISIGATMALCP